MPKPLVSFLSAFIASGPVASAATPMASAAAEPSTFQMQLLWYVVGGFMALLGALGTWVQILEYKEKKADRADRQREAQTAGERGGYVTYEMLLAQLESVYAKMDQKDAELLRSVVHSVEELTQKVERLTNTVSHVHNQHTRLEGQLNPIITPAPVAPGPRRRIP